jgi:Spy/CpxP family protein refolding chaperone
MASFSTPPALETERRPGWLIASVALNLILVGLILAWLFMPHEYQKLVTWQRGVVPSLSTTDAALVTDAANRIAAKQADADTKVHEDYARVRTILSTEPLDRAALEQELNQVVNTRNGQETDVLHIFLEELTSVSPEGRAKLVAGMEKASRRYDSTGGH